MCNKKVHFVELWKKIQNRAGSTKNNSFFYEHHQHQSKLYNQKCATKKCISLNFVKKYKIGQGGVDTFL